MPFYIRARQQDIPTPTISSVASDDDDNYVTDPGQIFDKLPQPFRLIDKALNDIFEISWEKISALEEARELEAKRKRPPAHLPSKIFDKYSGVTCGCTTPNGLLFLGTNCTIVVLNPETEEELCMWAHETEVCVEKIQCVEAGSTSMHLIAIIDDMGFFKLLIFESNMFHLVCCPNELVEGTPKSNAFKFELSDDGCFVAIAFRSDQSAWVEVFKLPLDAWCREIENGRKEFLKKTESATSQLSPDEVTDKNENLQASDHQLNFPPIKFSTLIPNLKVTQPLEVAARPNKNAQEMLEEVGDSEVIGTGTSHVMTEKFLTLQDKLFSVLHEDDLQYAEEEPSTNCETLPSFHFLRPGIMEQDGLTKLDSGYSHIGIWWSQQHNFSIYRLNKTGKNVEFKPDSVWPQASNITCTAVGVNSKFLAIGTEDGAVALWHRSFGTVRSVVQLPNGAPISDITFLKVDPDAPASKYSHLAPVELLLGTSDGQVSLFRCNADEDLKIIIPAPDDKREKYAVIKAIPQLPFSFFLITKEGSLSLMDVDSGEVQHTFMLPDGFQYEHPVDAGNFSDHVGETLYIRGNTSSLDSNALFAYDLTEFSDLRKAEIIPKQSTGQDDAKPNIDPFTHRLEVLLAQRMQRQSSRTAVLASRWHNLHKQLDFVLNLKETLTVRKKENRYSQSSSTASRWSKTTTKIIAHNKDLKI